MNSRNAALHHERYGSLKSGGEGKRRDCRSCEIMHDVYVESTQELPLIQRCVIYRLEQVLAPAMMQLEMMRHDCDFGPVALGKHSGELDMSQIRFMRFMQVR
jgi:hypothetical protein